jgi:hypothetical protein
MQLNVDPDEVRAAADRWRMTVNDLNEGSTPPIAATMTWRSAAATDAIHAETAGATQAFAARISDTAAASHAVANLYENREVVGAGEIKAVLGAVTSPVAHVAGIATGSVGALSSAAIGAVGQLGGAAALGTSSLVNALTRSLSHVGGVPEVPSDQPPGEFESGTVE